MRPARSAATAQTKHKDQDEEAERRRIACLPLAEVMVRPCHDPSTARPALTNRAQENAGRFGRDDRLAVLARGRAKARPYKARARTGGWRVLRYAEAQIGIARMALHVA
jgi:hypothetical protein